MPAKKAATKGTNKAVKSRTDASSTTFTAGEKAAMRERAKELKAAANRAEAESALHAKIAEMPAADRAMAKRIHAIVTGSTPDLSPTTWYGMPAYANKDGKIVCFFQAADKFKARYATFGFNPDAKLDDGGMWPTSWALTKLTAADEAKIGALVKKSVS